MTIRGKSKVDKKTRKAQMVGERKNKLSKKSFYNVSDVIVAIHESLNLERSEGSERAIRRIVNLMNDITGNKNLKIKEEDVFNKIVGITKRIYQDDNGNLKKLMSKEFSKKNLTVEEYDVLINKDKSLEEQKKLQNLVETLKGDDLIKEAEELREFFNKEYTNAINMLLDIQIENTRIECLNKYKASIYNSMNKFKDEIKDIQMQHNAIINVLKKEPNILNKEELKKGILSEDLQVKILVEMDLEDAIREYSEFKNKS